MTDEVDDEGGELIARARAGDPDAVRDLMCESLDFLRGQVHAARERKSPERESDVLQSSILRLLQGLPGFRGDNRASFRAWSKQIVRNTVLEKRRYRATGSRTKEILVEKLPEVPAESERPSGEARKIEQLMRINHGLRTLNDNQRRAFELRVIDGCAYAVIAAELEISEAAARVLVSRARAALAIELARSPSGRDDRT